MAEIAQKNAAAADDPAPLRNQSFRTFKGVYTRATRTAIPDDYFYDLENIIPIGDENAHVVPNLSAPLVNYSTDTIYWSQGVNLNGTDYLVNFSVTGKVFFFNIGTGTSTQVNAGHLLSGAQSQCDQWKNTVILFIDSTGYYSYDGTNFTPITGAGVPSAGNSIAVFQNRVWIVNGRLLTFTGLDDYTAASFTAANGAGTVNLTDPFIRSTVQRLKAQTGYLYLVSATAINVISDVIIPTGANPPTPTFQNQNIQPLIGSDQPASLQGYDRYLGFASRYGLHTLSGLVAPKISGDIDGTWQYVDFSQPISGGQVVVENILCMAFLLKRLNDPIFGSNQVVALWFQRTEPSPQTGALETYNIWWFANYGALNFIVSAFKNNVPTLFGFNNTSVQGQWIGNVGVGNWVNAGAVQGQWQVVGNQLFQLFADPTTAPAVKIMTKLWPMEDELARKECIMAGFEAFYFLYGSSQVLTLDTENQSTPLSTQLNVAAGNWINALAQQGQWVNGVGTAGGWVAPALYLVPADAKGGYGHHVGLTLSTVGYSYELHFLALDYKLRDRWL